MKPAAVPCCVPGCDRVAFARCESWIPDLGCDRPVCAVHGARRSGRLYCPACASLDDGVPVFIVRENAHPR